MTVLIRIRIPRHARNVSPLRSFDDIHIALVNGAANYTDFVKSVIRNIHAATDLHAFIEVFETTALEKAKSVEERLKQGKAGKLAGMIIALKDNICYKDHELSASSAILKGFRSLYSATVVERLLQEDAVIIGRLNCDEFAMGSSNENSVYGPVKNPLDKTKVPGGSSGGASAAVAAGLCHVALGSDTGGSIRQPASFTGTIGMKPTYGRVSRHGLIAYASSFDQIGPIAMELTDLALVMEVISGKDGFDSTCLAEQTETFSRFESPSGKLRIAYFRSYVEHEGLDAEIKERFFELLEELTADGHEVQAHDFPFLKHLVPTYYVLTTAEASSNLARYDGIHFGYRASDTADLLSTYVESRTRGFGPEVKRRIMLGTYVLSAGYYDAYYTKGQRIRRLIRNATDKVFSAADIVLGPTSPHTAFTIGSRAQDPIKMYLEDIFTVQANISGNPAISLPLGIHSNGMPYGIQAMSGMFRDKDLLNFSNYLINKTRLVSRAT